jgi:uncharacterized protein Yka (UPF0111/DUF47 family)
MARTALRESVFLSEGGRVRREEQIEPATHEEFKFYVDKYVRTYPQMKELIREVSRHAARQDRGQSPENG